MARGRKPKVKEEAIIPAKIDYAKLLKHVEEEQQVQLETFYKDLAKVKENVDEALTRVGFIDEAESVADAAFKAGRAYGFIDKANDKLEEMLESIYSKTDLHHWDDINDN